MHIGVLGLSYKSAEIGLRESVSKACLQKISRDSELSAKLHCVVLATCNRLEIYFSAEDLAEAHSEILSALREEIDVSFEHKLYSFFGFDCFMHLARVTAGLDSAITFESEIQRQVKVAYEQTLLYYTIPGPMHFLFQKSLKLGKKIRSDLSLVQYRVSLPNMLLEISQDVLKNVADLPILFIGNSEINRKIIAYFQRKGIRNLTLCTRSVHSAKQIFGEELTLIPWERLSSWQEHSIVICGSNASHCLADRPEGNVQTRLIFDLSVPRNVHPSLSRHPQLILLNMEKLTDLIELRQEKNQHEIERAENIIIEGVQRYHFSYRQKERTLVIA